MKHAKMRILFFIDCLNSGGKERRLTELMKALIEKPDIEFELVVMSNEIYYQEILDMRINIHYLIRKTKKDFSVLHKFYEICKRYNPDIVHCWDSMTAVYSVPVCKLLNIKLVNGLVIDTPTTTNILNKHWLRAKLTFPFSSTIVGNSEAGLAAYNAPKNKSFLIYNGFNFKRIGNLIDKNIIRNELKIHTTFVVGMVASFSKYKDYETYFHAAQLLLSQRSDITFLAIGNNTDTVLAQNHISDSYIKHFRLLGKKTDVESLINAMDICVLSTFTEGISNSILEYMSLGKPVVATKGGGTAEIILNNKTGFLIEQKNPNVLAEKVNILLENEDLRKVFGENAKNRIKEKFSIKLMVQGAINCYEQSLNIKGYGKISSKQIKKKFLNSVKSDS